jgi:hypothetical protein
MTREELEANCAMVKYLTKLYDNTESEELRASIRQAWRILFRERMTTGSPDETPEDQSRPPRSN